MSPRQRRTAVVTGAGSGLGAVIARRLAADRLHVLVVDRDREAAAAVVAQITESSGSAEPLWADLAEVDSADALAVRIRSASPTGLAALVNCAGGWAGQSMHYPDSAPQDWDTVLRLNLTVPMRLLQALRPLLAAAGGAVVNIASSAGVETTSYACPEYAVAKAGLVRLTTSLAGLADEGVRVSCLVPGWIGLPRAHNEVAALSEAERRNLPALVPPDLLADEVAELIADPASAGRVVLMLDGAARAVRSSSL